MDEKKEKPTKETTKRGPGLYTEDDGTITYIRSDGRVIKNARGYQETPFSYKTHIKPTIDFITRTGKGSLKDLGFAVHGATALPRVLFHEIGNVISDIKYKTQIKNESLEMVWSEKYNKYMSKYDLKIQDYLDATKESENSDG